MLCGSVRLLAYNNVFCHSDGDDDVRPDLLTRLSILKNICHLVRVPLLPTTLKEFDWPSASSVHDSQNKHAHSRPANAVLIDELRRVVEPAQFNPIWV